jgi:protein-S-isoprenylcysteine O-methyltransferase Ste14
MPSWSRVARRIRVPLGFVFAAVYLWLARPAWASLLWALPLIIAGLALRAAASGHVRKDAVLTTSGPYAYTRNPLYLGSALLALGFVLAARSMAVAMIVIAGFVAIYLPVIHAEESHLRANFPGYEEYARKVPRFFPRIKRAGKAGSFSAQLYWKHREYNALIGAMGMFGALVAKLLYCR